MNSKNNKEVRKITKNIMEENNKLLSDLSKGPNGEYHHTLEEKLVNIIQENKILKEFVKEVAKGPYEDSNAKSLLLSLKTRARKLLNE